MTNHEHFNQHFDEPLLLVFYPVIVKAVRGCPRLPVRKRSYVPVPESLADRSASTMTRKTHNNHWLLPEKHAVQILAFVGNDLHLRYMRKIPKEQSTLFIQARILGNPQNWERSTHAVAGERAHEVKMEGGEEVELGETEEVEEAKEAEERGKLVGYILIQA